MNKILVVLLFLSCSYSLACDDNKDDWSKYKKYIEIENLRTYFKSVREVLVLYGNQENFKELAFDDEVNNQLNALKDDGENIYIANSYFKIFDDRKCAFNNFPLNLYAIAKSNEKVVSKELDYSSAKIRLNYALSELKQINEVCYKEIFQD